MVYLYIECRLNSVLACFIHDLPSRKSSGCLGVDRHHQKRASNLKSVSSRRFTRCKEDQVKESPKRGLWLRTMSPKDGAEEGDVETIGADKAQTAHNETQDRYRGKDESDADRSLTPGQKRLRDEKGDGSESDGYSPAATNSPRSAKRAKRAKVSASPSGSPASSHHGSEEGEIEESDSENPRAALEHGKISRTTANNTAPSAPATQSSGKSRSLPAESNSEKEDLGDAETFEGASMVPNPPSYTHGSLTLLLPSLSEKKTGSWSQRCKDWVKVLCINNIAHSKAITPEVALAAYQFYIDEYSGLKSGKKRSAKQTAKRLEISQAFQKEIEQVRHAATGVSVAEADSATAEERDDKPRRDVPETARSNRAESSAQGIQEGAASPSQQGGNDRNGDAGINDKSAISDAELQQQRRYFPSAVDPSNMCLFCGQHGHTAAQCSRSTCAFCGGSGHWDYVCSSIPRRCDKCRQLGHTISDCVEKLNLTKDEGLACAYCSSPDHLEAECTAVWRSFHPDSQPVKTVIYLPPSCSICGAASHYSGDCAQRGDVPANPTWTMRNRSHYMDRDSGVCGIDEDVGRQGASKSLRPPDTKIRGHASRTANVHYSSDESEPEFLGRRPVSKQRGAGHIRMSSNIQMPQLTTGSLGVNSLQPLAGQPPLPPGPPPPLNGHHPPAPRGYIRAAGPASLPQRPPPRDYRDFPGRGGVSRGDGQDSRRGRGGRGGRGRGRGRGRPRGS